MELLPRQIDSGDAVAIGAMAELALAGIEPIAGLDLFGAVLVILGHRRRGQTSGAEHPGHNGKPR